MSVTDNKSMLAFSRHDHDHCESALLHQAFSICEQRSVRLTPRRLQVLKILLRSHQPMGAYEVLQSMNEMEPGITPPIVYRALDFLQQQGLVHRIESRHAFIPCAHPGHDCDVRFLICSGCQRVAELESRQTPSLNEAKALDFEVSHAVVEINGLCASCRNL